MKSNIKSPAEYCGLSTDEKPTENVPVNSLFLELDTGDFYFLETPAQSGKEILIPQQSFTGDDYHYHAFSPGTKLSADVIQVVFDGVTYSCERRGKNPESGYEYGATYDEEMQAYDFSQYPFVLLSSTEDDEWYTEIEVADGNEHTIEVSADSSTPAVWKKVGSGGSTPQTELPKITISMTPNKVTEVYNNVACILGDTDVFYDKYGNEIDPESWTDVVSFNANETKTVTAYAAEFDDGGETIYLTSLMGCVLDFDSATASNEVNCEYSDGDIVVTDPTQDASISLSVHIQSLG